MNQPYPFLVASQYLIRRQVKFKERINIAPILSTLLFLAVLAGYGKGCGVPRSSNPPFDLANTHRDYCRRETGVGGREGERERHRETERDRPVLLYLKIFALSM